MTTTELLDRGRSGFERHVWGEAYAALSAADQIEPLIAEDLQRLAVAAHLVGEDDASAAVWERAHQELLNRGEVARAVRCAFWLAFELFNRAEMARGSGWLARARRLLDDHNLDCVEQGYLLVPVALGTMEGGDPSSAHAMFGQVTAVGNRFGDPDLMTLGRLGQGSALIRMGQIDQGLVLLDEAMVAVTAEEVSAIVAGTVYCAVILFCQEVFDLRRAHEWTEALSDWCEAQPDMVPFRGQCLVHRSEIMQLHGAWPQAMVEVARACDRLADPPGQPAIGMAYYQRGELYRLRGDFVAAETAFRQASQCGREPQPGLAQLRLAQGQVAGAQTAIRRVLAETHDRGTRAKALAAAVEIMVAAGDVDAARAAADELAATAAALDAPLLDAMAAVATGAVLLAAGDPRAGLNVLRRGCAAWRELDAPYEHARARVLVARACRQLGDDEAADLELDAAQRVFAQLGAAPDHAAVVALRRMTPVLPGGLTGREVEVLALVATGKTNREIAAELVVSEHTIRRHLHNIFVKLGVSSRAAATAYAFEHGLT